jgi:hypothetical protein
MSTEEQNSFLDWASAHKDLFENVLTELPKRRKTGFEKIGAQVPESLKSGFDEWKKDISTGKEWVNALKAIISEERTRKPAEQQQEESLESEQSLTKEVQDSVPEPQPHKEPVPVKLYSPDKPPAEPAQSYASRSFFQGRAQRRESQINAPPPPPKPDQGYVKPDTISEYRQLLRDADRFMSKRREENRYSPYGRH